MVLIADSVLYVCKVRAHAIDVCFGFVVCENAGIFRQWLPRVMEAPHCYLHFPTVYQVGALLKDTNDHATFELEYYKKGTGLNGPI